MSKKHPGFVTVAKGIAQKSHVSIKEARRELAGATRRDSAKAKAKNPRLKRVKG